MPLCPDSWPLIGCTGTESPGESPSPDDPTCSHLAELPVEVQEVIEEAAVEFLWNATGQRFGLCEAVVRPCGKDCWDSSTYTGWSGAPAGGIYGPFGWGWGGGLMPYMFGGNWYNLACGDCSGTCDSSHMDSLRLPGPVAEVVEVTIDGAPFTAWNYDNWGLNRTDGKKWPRSQNMSAPLSDNNTFGVTYMRGLAVPKGGQLAAGKLACELAKFQCGDGTCQLPKQITTITREGVTASFVNNFGLLADAGKAGPLTGLWIIDQWISSVNYASRRRASVKAPNVRPTRKVGP